MISSSSSQPFSLNTTPTSSSATSTLPAVHVPSIIFPPATNTPTTPPVPAFPTLGPGFPSTPSTNVSTATKSYRFPTPSNPPTSVTTGSRCLSLGFPNSPAGSGRPPPFLPSGQLGSFYCLKTFQCPPRGGPTRSTHPCFRRYWMLASTFLRAMPRVFVRPSKVIEGFASIFLRIAIR